MKLLLTTLTACLAGIFLLASHRSPTLAADLIFQGIVRPHRVLDLGAATDGLLQTVRFDRGDRIAAGDLVATLDARVAQAQADLARARANRVSAARMVESRLQDARRRLAAQESLLADGVSSTEAVDTIRTEVHLEELALAQQEEERVIAEHELQRALAALAQTRIVSPLSGVVVERHLSPGEFYSRTGASPVLTIAKLDPLVVEVNVPLEQFDEVQVGDLASIYLDANGDPVREARVTAKDYSIDTASRTFHVRFELPNPNFELPAGLRCRVTFHE